MKKKNKGFTLVELLGAIVILSVLATVATMSVTSLINKSKKGISLTAENNLVDAGVTYVKENNIKLVKCSEGYKVSSASDTGNCIYKVTVDTLIKSGFFSDDASSCKKDANVLVYRYVDPDSKIDEYKGFVESGTCLKK